ncbi:MAG: hypothetical protein HGA31_02525 [Candidatus Moranbacteria bacterium]|nr:hypothetical protein [Candidatus Moranbacteria bacterium]
MHTLRFSVANTLSVGVGSDHPLDLSDGDETMFRSYVPGIVRADSVSGRADVTIEHVESTERRMARTETGVRIFDAWESRFPDYLPHLLYGMVRTRLLERRLFCVHGACVGTDQGYVLIVGHSGAGKTSVTLRMMERPGTRLFSGNKTVISFGEDGCLNAVAGTPTITVREPEKEKMAVIGATDLVAKWGRYAGLPSPDRLSVSDAVAIRHIAIVRVDDSRSECVILDNSSALHALFPFFLDAVNADVVLDRLEDVFMGTADDELGRYLSKKLRDTLATVPVGSITGSSVFVAEKLSGV